jgi:hypothetical protein
LKVKRRADGWSAIVYFPLAAFKLASGEKTKLKWLAAHVSKHHGVKEEKLVYKGLPLHYSRYPIIVE